MNKFIFLIIFLCACVCLTHAQILKSVVYDFDGLDIGQTDLPDGDYRNNDLTYQVAATPLVNSDVLGDRALQLDINWNTGQGEFGKAISRFIDLNCSSDYLNFYFYNPLANGNDSILQVTITEDDNANNIYEFASDDKWTYNVILQRSAGWQLISIPLNSFTDDNVGGNGIFDVGYENAGSMLFSLGFIFNHTSPATLSEHYFIDMINFSEGIFPTGATILDLPADNTGDLCSLGALTDNDFPDNTPNIINNLLLPNKLKFVNWFLPYAKTGTIANTYPGNEVSNLLSAGYTPVITWEMIYESYPRLDPVQPHLNQILNGSFDTYIDAFADQIKSYNQPVILRIFHEFEGNWYSWSLTENNADPATYIAAWKYVVDRFRARGTNNVQWMWCVNTEPKPYVDYNWIVDAYPGSSYVDIVGVDIYNHPDPGIPAWKSFRYTLAESYYYLTRHFPDKPFYICEVACRERDSSEDLSSQTKGQWTCQMSKDLQSYFCKTKALIFFSIVKEHDWRINSSTDALNALSSCVWNNNHFTKTGLQDYAEIHDSFDVYPNPFSNELTISMNDKLLTNYRIKIYDITEKKVYELNSGRLPKKVETTQWMLPGVYIVELVAGNYSTQTKIVKIRE